MSLTKQISVRVFRTLLYPPVGVFWGAIMWFGAGIVLCFWAWLLSLVVHFDLKGAASACIGITLSAGLVGGFLVGLGNGIFGDVDD